MTRETPPSLKTFTRTNCPLQTFEDIDLFNLIGIICGLAIYNLTIVELNFPLALYKKLLKRKPTLDDLKELMPDVGRSVPLCLFFFFFFWYSVNYVKKHLNAL